MTTNNPTVLRGHRAFTSAEREEIAEQLRRMGQDPDYQREAEQIDREFAEADIEASKDPHIAGV